MIHNIKSEEISNQIFKPKGLVFYGIIFLVVCISLKRYYEYKNNS